MSHRGRCSRQNNLKRRFLIEGVRTDIPFSQIGDIYNIQSTLHSIDSIDYRLPVPIEQIVYDRRELPPGPSSLLRYLQMSGGISLLLPPSTDIEWAIGHCKSSALTNQNLYLTRKLYCLFLGSTKISESGKQVTSCFYHQVDISYRGLT